MSKVKELDNHSSYQPVQIEILPSERRYSSVVVGCGGCSCCCCCCCLHSVGGVVGAAISSGMALMKKPTAADYYVYGYSIESYKKSVKTVVSLYWIVLLIISSSILIFGLMPFLMAISFAFGILQLIASIICILVVKFFFNSPKQAASKAIFNIFANSLLGTFIGLVVMLLGALVLFGFLR